MCIIYILCIFNSLFQSASSEPFLSIVLILNFLKIKLKRVFVIHKIPTNCRRCLISLIFCIYRGFYREKNGECIKVSCFREQVVRSSIKSCLVFIEYKSVWIENGGL